MSKYEKLIVEDSVKKEYVLKILEILNNESYSDAKTILDTAQYFLTQNSYLDFNLAQDLINNLVIEDDD